jgi:hypothetical protein
VNHVDTLSDIISKALDGAENSTALFLPSKDVSSMTLEESHNNFTCHAAFIAQLQRIPLHPYVINIDRVRSEIIDGKKTGALYSRLDQHTSSAEWESDAMRC